MEQKLQEVQLSDISLVNNVRVHYDEAAMKDLVASIQKNGILQPLVCTDGKGKKIILVAGYRRHRAAKELKLKMVPIVLRPGLGEDEILDLQLEENLRREDLDPIDEGTFLSQYRKKRGDITIEELSKKDWEVTKIHHPADRPGRSTTPGFPRNGPEGRTYPGTGFYSGRTIPPGPGFSQPKDEGTFSMGARSSGKRFVF